MAHFAGRDWVRGNRYGTAHTSTYEEPQYEPLENAFYVGGGALIDALTDTTSRETLLGTLGVHIGHELSHGFDTAGSQYNADFTGSLFTENDLEIFREKSESIARQLSRIEVLDGIYGNGELQIREVLADLTGMSLTLDLAGKTENFDYDAFFRAFASYFARYYHSREALANNIAYMAYPMGYIRNNFCVAHFDEFYRTYPSVTEGTPMYIAPEDRILVW